MVKVNPQTKERFKKKIGKLIKDLGRPVKIYKQPAKSECPNCYYDKLTTSSTGKCKWTIIEALNKQAEWEAEGNSDTRYQYFIKGRCPICLGKGFLITDRIVWVNCKVTWAPDAARGFGNELTFTSAGIEGSTLVELKTDLKWSNTFKNCTKLVVDGVECKLSRPPLSRGLGDQALLIITAFTTEKPSVDSDEIIKDYS